MAFMVLNVHPVQENNVFVGDALPDLQMESFRVIANAINAVDGDFPDASVYWYAGGKLVGQGNGLQCPKAHEIGLGNTFCSQHLCRSTLHHTQPIIFVDYTRA